jgi:Serine acetyltransferase
MIQNKKDLKYYLECDRLTMQQSRKKPGFLTDDIWRYLIILRKLEYQINCRKGLIQKIKFYYLQYIHHRLSFKLGIEIPPNSFGAGLALFHGGTIAINSSAKTGENCQLYQGVSIAMNSTIGNNVYIGPGAKILIGVTIADNIRIGANAVVTKSFSEQGITIGGIPARKISDNGSTHLRGTEEYRKLYL